MSKDERALPPHIEAAMAKILDAHKTTVNVFNRLGKTLSPDEYRLLMSAFIATIASMSYGEECGARIFAILQEPEQPSYVR